MTQACLVVAVVAILLVSHGVSAKRGCSAFGHSCFGGHGKRSDSAMDTSPEMIARHQPGQEETAPHPVYPHSGYNGVLPPGDDIIPVRDGGVYEDAAAKDVMKFKLRNIVQHWMDNYRRSQQNDDGYFIENL
ncbi:neuropeptide CCHamide-2 isoform X2 [Plodia interpunctella]|uniref:neuropeptide CCHamide-2 isoform X2 n=1 Tax=Plodia interpunctella TaxID=58824 RepID=UPI002368C15F|nr:neuropeptide CCHamide-2 isoform X2 [Plodia interpunctella]